MNQVGRLNDGAVMAWQPIAKHEAEMALRWEAKPKLTEEHECVSKDLGSEQAFDGLCERWASFAGPCLEVDMPMEEVSRLIDELVLTNRPNLDADYTVSEAEVVLHRLGLEVRRS